MRERALEGGALLRWTRSLSRAARQARDSVRVLVNRRADVALAAGADGLHLGHDAMDPADARRLLGPKAQIGVSLHDPDEIEAAGAASYAQLAPIFEPLSKAASRPALGLSALRAAAGRGLPVLAQGGVEARHAAALLAAGAAGVAVTGAVLMAEDPGAAAAALRAALDGRRR